VYVNKKKVFIHTIHTWHVI